MRVPRWAELRALLHRVGPAGLAHYAGGGATEAWQGRGGAATSAPGSAHRPAAGAAVTRPLRAAAPTAGAKAAERSPPGGHAKVLVDVGGAPDLIRTHPGGRGDSDAAPPPRERSRLAPPAAPAHDESTPEQHRQRSAARANALRGGRGAPEGDEEDDHAAAAHRGHTSGVHATKRVVRPAVGDTTPARAVAPSPAATGRTNRGGVEASRSREANLEEEARAVGGRVNDTQPSRHAKPARGLRPDDRGPHANKPPAGDVRSAAASADSSLIPSSSSFSTWRSGEAPERAASLGQSRRLLDYDLGAAVELNPAPPLLERQPSAATAAAGASAEPEWRWPRAANGGDGARAAAADGQQDSVAAQARAVLASLAEGEEQEDDSCGARAVAAGGALPAANGVPASGSTPQQPPAARRLRRPPPRA